MCLSKNDSCLVEREKPYFIGMQKSPALLGFLFNKVKSNVQETKQKKIVKHYEHGRRLNYKENSVYKDIYTGPVSIIWKDIRNWSQINAVLLSSLFNILVSLVPIHKIQFARI